MFVEPLLDWKGDTIVAPTGSPDPEGSITANMPVTSPSHGQTVTSVSPAVERVVSTESRLVDDRAGNAGVQSVSGVLWNNQYAA